MIDAKEIRAGNWVITHDGDTAVERQERVYKLVKEDEYSFTFARQYSPIPLSAEVLADSSFKHSFGNWFKNLYAEGVEGGLPLLRYNLKTSQWYLFERKLPFQPVFLHQLQNLYYALTNQELSITLRQMPTDQKETETVLRGEPSLP
ncbi:MAG TPA: hypothetical protein VMR70_08180 [Flavisolibacter sp.]|nr:hypothetical protein [Flavisolibacter sp.]